MSHKAPHRYTDLFAGLSLFQGLSARELDRIASLCTMIERPAGHVLCEEGECGREFVVVVEGEVSLTIGGTEIAALGPGSFLGELALLDHQPRSATAVAVTPVRILVFQPREFEALMTGTPRIARRMLATVGGRLRDADTHLRAADGPP